MTKTEVFVEHASEIWAVNYLTVISANHSLHLKKYSENHGSMRAYL